MTRYDALTFGRTAVVAVAIGALAYTVMLATDGSMTTPREKMGLLSVLAPLVGATATLLTTGQASARGELRALAAIGTSPTRSCAGALACLALCGVIGASALMLGQAEVGMLFPRPGGADWVASSTGWILPDAGVRVGPAGPTFADVTARHHEFSTHRVPVAAMVAWLTLALVDWVRDEISGWERTSVAVGTGAVAITLFHLTAADRISAWGLLVVPLPLIGHAWCRRAVRGWLRLSSRRPTAG